MTLDLTVTDLFCGAGGSSIGAERSGARLRMAANHWSLAIETHNSNFPDADHDCADVSQVDPRRYPKTDILLASPECTHHSQARSKKHDPNLFDPAGDPAAERSRATMWDVPRFVEQHRYQIVVVENVVEVRRWAPFNAWLEAMHSFGYEHEIVYLNSMVAPPTPQSRDRLYVVFWRKGNTAPDLDIRPRCLCQRCGDVEGRQAWKKADKPGGKYRQQYIYVCSTCGDRALPYAWPAASAIDWSLPCPKVSERTRPLAAATLRRIAVGLERFGPAAIVQKSGHTFEREGYARAWSVMAPMVTQTTEIHHALVVETAFGGDDRVRTAADVFMTQTGRQTLALVPFIAELRGGGSREKVRSVEDPAATVTASGNHHALVTPFTIDYHGNGRAHRVDEPLGTFYLKNYGDGNDPTMAHPVTDPLGSVTTKDHHSVVEPAYDVQDCGFRMLEPHEIGKAMAFPETYKVLGNKREKVRQYGNAVTPPVMELIVERCIGSLS